MAGRLRRFLLPRFLKRGCPSVGIAMTASMIVQWICCVHARFGGVCRVLVAAEFGQRQASPDCFLLPNTIRKLSAAALGNILGLYLSMA